MRVIGPCLALALLCASAEAAPADGRCPSLFGDEETRERNARARERRLITLAVGEAAIDLIYQGDRWAAPVFAHVQGVHVDSVQPYALEPTATVTLSGSPLCPSGSYVLRADDDLGPGVTVIAILDEGLLVESEGALFFAPLDRRQVPPFRMVWRSSYTLVYPQPVMNQPRPKPSPPARPGRK